MIFWVLIAGQPGSFRDRRKPIVFLSERPASPLAEERGSSDTESWSEVEIEYIDGGVR
jgi:hypothetical protein